MRRKDERETSHDEEDERLSDWLVALLAAHAEAPPGRGVTLEEVELIARGITFERHREAAEWASERAGADGSAFAADALWSEEEIARLAAGVRLRVAAARRQLGLETGEPEVTWR